MSCLVLVLSCLPFANFSYNTNLSLFFLRYCIYKMDKIRRTGLDAGRGGDVSADNPTRGGSNLVGKAAHTTSNLKDEAKGMMSRHRMGMGGLGAGSTAGRRSSRVMSGPEMTNDFLKNYSFEIKSEIGESEPGDGIRR